MKEFEIDVNKMTTLPDPYNYEYYENRKSRIININDIICDTTIDNVVLPLIRMDNDGTGKKITIYLNTPGGDVYDGFALCSVIEKIKTPLEIIVMGYVMSMGALILMSGFKNSNVKRICNPYSVGLIHDGSTGAFGTLSQVKDTTRFNEKYEMEKVRPYILSHSNITEEEYIKKERVEWYLTADEMLKLGLVDEIR